MPLIYLSLVYWRGLEWGGGGGGQNVEQKSRPLMF